MAPPGPPTAITVEVEFTPGVWTDLSTRLRRSGVDMTQRGRATPYDDVGPTLCQLVLDNDGSLTPDNNLSVFWPNVVEGKRLRVTVAKGASSSVRFLGGITGWTPAPGVNPATGTVTITAADDLSKLATRVMDSNWVEDQALVTVGEWEDCFPLDDGASNATTIFRNAGSVNGINPALGTAVIVPAATGRGSFEVAKPDDISLNGAITFAPTSGIGPILRVLPQAAGSQVIEFYLKVPAGTRPATGTTLVLAEFLAGNAVLFSLRLTNNAGVQTDANLYNAAGANVNPIFQVCDDGAWHYYLVATDGATGVNVFVDRGATGVASIATADPATITRIHIGGTSSATNIGKNTLCPPMSVAGLGITNNFVSTDTSLTDPAATAGAVSRLAQLITFATPSLIAALTLVGTENRRVVRADTSGRNLLDVLQETARSVQAYVWVTPAGVPQIVALSGTRKPTVAATITLQSDDDARTDQIWTRAVATKPTRVTATSPYGQVTAIDTAAEALGTRREGSVTTVCSTEADLLTAATSVLNAATSLRLAQFAVDLALAANDLYAALWALIPGARLRLTPTPSAILGFTYVDVFAEGWTEHYDPDSAVFTFDCSPADAPPAGIFDNAEYGRFSGAGTMAVTGGTAVGVTGNGTLVVTTSGDNPVLTTNAANYPLDLDWNGERVTIAAVPTSSALKAPVTGLGARGTGQIGARAADYGFVTVDSGLWSQLQPTNGGAIDTASAAWTDLQTGLASGLPVRWRLFAGVDAPTWAKNLGGGPLTIIDPTAPATPLTVPKWWSAAYLAAWADFMTKIAALVDGNAQIREIAAHPATTLFAEPHIRQTAPTAATAGVNNGKTNVQVYYEAGLLGAQLSGSTPIAPDAQDVAALSYPYDLVGGVPRWVTFGFTKTLYYLPWNPTQTWKVTSTSPFTYTQVADPNGWTRLVSMPGALANLGAQLVMANNSLRTPLVEAGTNYPILYQEQLTENATNGFQTATAANLLTAYQTVVPAGTQTQATKAVLDVGFGIITTAADPLGLISSPVTPALRGRSIELPAGGIALLTSPECTAYNAAAAANLARSGAGSPQTATTTARGVAPTVARVHAAGEPIDVWHAATFA